MNKYINTNVTETSVKYLIVLSLISLIIGIVIGYNFIESSPGKIVKVELNDDFSIITENNRLANKQ